ncbi:MAG: O-methyltransferase [Alkaliphilus sp.]
MNSIINPSVEKYIKDMLPNNTGILHEMEEYADRNHVPIIHKEVAALVKVITKASGATKILEIGTAIAYSTITFCIAMGNEGNINTIERNENMCKIATANIERTNLKERIRLIQGDAGDVLMHLDEEYDLIFLDSAKSQYSEYLNDLLRLLKSGGILISDNVLYKGMVADDELVLKRKKTIVYKLRDYLATITNHPELDTCILPIGDGVAISYKKQGGSINE